VATGLAHSEAYLDHASSHIGSMSTPSTATAPVPPHHAHYAYHGYQSANATYPVANAAPPRLTASYNTFPATDTASKPSRPHQSPQSSKQPSHPTTMPSSQSASTLSRIKRERGQPNWGEYFKNGVPKEVIVIHDDTPTPDPQTSSRGKRPHDTPRQETESTAPNPAKKRRTGVDSAYNVTYQERPSYSLSHHQGGQSAETSTSVDRTRSVQTTAPTSLSSAGSNGAYAEEANVGQKRKRVTRKSMREEAKRREAEQSQDAFNNYIPPPKPPIKASEVHVPVIREVSSFYPWTLRKITDYTSVFTRSTKELTTTTGITS
jgi:dual-specificity kinase